MEQFRTIRVLMPDLTVRRLLMEQYLRGVVPYEMPPTWPLEALKAQAVAARTYAAFAIKNPRHAAMGADVCTGVHCQVYKDVPVAATDEAIRQTSGVLLWYRDRLVNAVFSARCGGHTINNEARWGGRPAPYLRGVPCPCNSVKYGHGVGMCQTGARVMAQGGRSFERILTHYYSGTHLSGGTRWSSAALVELLRARFPGKFFDVRADMPVHPTRQPEWVDFDRVIGVAVHHTGLDSTFKRVADYHVFVRDPARNKEEWPTIAYTIGVGWGGRVFLLKDVEIVGYHVPGRDEELLSLAVAGNLLARDPTPEESASVRGVLEVYEEFMGRRLDIRGHNEWALAGGETTCPGPTLTTLLQEFNR